MRLACLALAACSIGTPAFAQSAPSALPSAEDIAGRDMITIAGGAGITADYEGSDDYRFIPVAAIRGTVSGFSFSTRNTYFYFDAIPHRALSSVEFNVGPIVGARFNTRKKIEDDVVKLLPNLNNAIEAGGFAGVSLHGVTNPYDTLAFRVDVLHDIGSAHKSTVISPNVEFSTPLSFKTYASANIGADFVSNRFADYYFGITPADSALTGGLLPVFNPDGGMKDWRAGLLLNQSITGNLLGGFSVFGTGQYTRLVGDFKRSPIVADRGSASQWLGALGIAYTW